MPIFKIGDLVVGPPQNHVEYWKPMAIYHIINPDSEHCTLVCVSEDGDTHYLKLSEVVHYNPVFTKNEQSEKVNTEKKHSHYYKDVSHLEFIDVYRVLELYNVTDPCIQHAVKKLLVAGGRGGGKDIKKDLQEAIDTITRSLEMRKEDE